MKLVLRVVGLEIRSSGSVGVFLGAGPVSCPVKRAAKTCGVCWLLFHFFHFSLCLFFSTFSFDNVVLWLEPSLHFLRLLVFLCVCGWRVGCSCKNCILSLLSWIHIFSDRLVLFLSDTLLLYSPFLAFSTLHLPLLPFSLLLSPPLECEASLIRIAASAWPFFSPVVVRYLVLAWIENTRRVQRIPGGIIRVYGADK